MSERKFKDAIFAPREAPRRARISWMPQAHKAPPNKVLAGLGSAAPNVASPSPAPPRPSEAHGEPAHAEPRRSDPSSPADTSREGKATVPTSHGSVELVVPPPPMSSGALPIGTHGFFDDLPEIPPPPASAPQSSAEAAIESFVQAAEAMSEIRALRQSRVERDLVELSRAIASRIIGRELQADPGILVALARDGISALAERENVVVRFAADVPAELRTSLTEAVSHRAPGCTVLFDPELASGSCVVESAQGYVDESVSTRLDVVMEQLGFGGGGME